MNAALALGIDAQTWRVGGAMILAFCAAAGWMLAGPIVADTGRPATGRHRGGRRLPRSAQVTARRHRAARRSRHADTTPDVFDRVLAATGGDAVLPVLPFKAPSGFYRLDFDIEPDDWVADLPTEQFPAIVEQPPIEQPSHTSPTERARERWGIDCPIFARLAEDWGYELGGELRAVAA